jgi:hypothetical protein
MLMGTLGQDTSDLTAGDGLLSDDDIADAESGSFSSDTSASLLTTGSDSLTASDLSSGNLVSNSDLTASSALAPITSSSTTSSDPLTAILTALGVGAATVVGGAISGAVLQQTNAQRMAQGLPPLTATGAVMTAAQMAAAGYSSAQIAAVASQLSPDMSTILIIGAVALGAVLLMSSRGNAS